MITIKLVGGAKKSFNSEQLQIEKSDLSVNELLEHLLKIKPSNTSELDIENLLIAINGSDSSAMDGKDTMISNGDTVSIIPIIHGGSSKKLSFEIERKQIHVIEIKGQKNIDIQFIDELREKYPKLKFQVISSNFVLNYIVFMFGLVYAMEISVFGWLTLSSICKNSISVHMLK